MRRALLAAAIVLSVAACSTAPQVGLVDPTAIKTDPPVVIAGMPAPGFEPPMLLEPPRPVYPLDAQLAGVQGTVILRGIVLMNGTLGSVEVSADDGRLASAVADAAETVRFEPARFAGAPIEVWVSIPVIFTLPPETRPPVPGGSATHLIERTQSLPDQPPPPTDRLGDKSATGR
jgi:protein TonB